MQKKIYTFLTFQNILEQLILPVYIRFAQEFSYYIYIHKIELRSFISCDFLLTHNDFGMSVKQLCTAVVEDLNKQSNGEFE